MILLTEKQKKEMIHSVIKQFADMTHKNVIATVEKLEKSIENEQLFRIDSIKHIEERLSTIDDILLLLADHIGVDFKVEPAKPSIPPKIVIVKKTGKK